MTHVLTNSRIFRFALVGAAVAAIYIALYLLFLQSGMPRLWANGLAFALAVAAQYLGQTLFTFRRDLTSSRQMLRFLIMIGLGLVTSALITIWLATLAGLSDLAAAVLVTIVLPMQNYLLMKAWVYAGPSQCSEI